MTTTVRVRDAKARDREARDPSYRARLRGCVAACFDGSECAEQVLPHAIAIAGALGVPLALIRVLEGETGQTLPDPFEWTIRRREGRDYLEQLASESTPEGGIPTALMEGSPAEEICLWCWRNDVSSVAICTHGAGGAPEWSFGSTARKLIECAPASLLVVPSDARPGFREARYRRILVPLDGSHRAESVLPLASRLAAAHDAELLLVHVVPVPELTEIGPLSTEDIELKEHVIRRNERVATDYLDRLRAGLSQDDAAPRVRVVHAADVRSRLVQLITETGSDFVVLAAHGRSERCDGPHGSVAAHLIQHSKSPLWIVRPRAEGPMRFGDSARKEKVRLPSQAAP